MKLIDVRGKMKLSQWMQWPLNFCNGCFHSCDGQHKHWDPLWDDLRKPAMCQDEDEWAAIIKDLLQEERLTEQEKIDVMQLERNLCMQALRDRGSGAGADGGPSVRRRRW